MSWQLPEPPPDAFLYTTRSLISMDIWLTGLYNQGFVVSVEQFRNNGNVYYRGYAWKEAPITGI